MQTIIVIAFLAYCGYREWLHHAHVKDLETMLIAKDSTDYARLRSLDRIAKVPKPAIDPEKDLIDPMEVDPTEAIRGIVQ